LRRSNCKILKGTKDGEKIRKIMAEGGLVPFELTVQILINGLIANPSKNYLIDGFPRSVEQAIYFEQHVCECQSVLFYDVSEDTLMERCLARASSSTV
jgi:adenylate kinase family enzyme